MDGGHPSVPSGPNVVRQNLDGSTGVLGVVTSIIGHGETAGPVNFRADVCSVVHKGTDSQATNEFRLPAPPSFLIGEDETSTNLATGRSALVTECINFMERRIVSIAGTGERDDSDACRQ